MISSAAGGASRAAPVPAGAAANGSPAAAGRAGGRQAGHSSSAHVAQAAAGALSSDISRRNPQDDYTLLQVGDGVIRRGYWGEFLMISPAG